MRNVVMMRIVERDDGWWVVVDGGPHDLIVPELRERGPLPSQAIACACAVDFKPTLADMVRPRGLRVLINNAVTT